MRLRRADHVGVAAEMGGGKNIAPDPAGVDAGAGFVNASGDFVTHHERDARKVRIEPEAAHDVGEVDSARLHPNAQLASGGMGIGRLPDLKDLGRASF